MFFETHCIAYKLPQRQSQAEPGHNGIRLSGVYRGQNGAWLLFALLNLPLLI